jgi:hypothetical protein
VGLGATATCQPTVGSLLNPLNIVQAIEGTMHPPLRDILTGFEGAVHPGEMLRESPTTCNACFCIVTNTQWSSGALAPAARLYRRRSRNNTPNTTLSMAPSPPTPSHRPPSLNTTEATSNSGLKTTSTSPLSP